MGEDVVNLPGDPVPLVQGGGAALLKAHLLGLGKQCRGLVRLDAVAEDEPADEKPEDHEQRHPEEAPGINPVGEPSDVDGDDPGRGDDARGRQAEVVGRDTGGHRGEDDERLAALRERRPATGHGCRGHRKGQHPSEQLPRGVALSGHSEAEGRGRYSEAVDHIDQVPGRPVRQGKRRDADGGEHRRQGRRPGDPVQPGRHPPSIAHGRPQAAGPALPRAVTK